MLEAALAENDNGFRAHVTVVYDETLTVCLKSSAPLDTSRLNRAFWDHRDPSGPLAVVMDV